MALNKGIAIGNVLSYDAKSKQFTNKVKGGIIEKLRDIGPSFVRLELLMAGYPQWDQHLVDAYIEIFSELKGLPTNPEIIAEVTQQSVPIPNGMKSISQTFWNTGHAEPGGKGSVDTQFTRLYRDALKSIMETTGSAVHETLRHFVHHWEIWNEPNAPTTYIYPSIYATILKAAIDDNGSNSDVKVLFGGVLCIDKNRSAWPVYVEQVGERMPGKLLGCHGMGQHLYLKLGGRDPLHSNKVLPPLNTRLSSTLDAMIKLQNKYSGGSQILITEAGFASTAAENKDAARYCHDLFRISRAVDKVAATCWFTLVDFNAGTTLNTKGIWDMQGNRKADLLQEYKK